MLFFYSHARAVFATPLRNLQSMIGILCLEFVPLSIDYIDPTPTPEIIQKFLMRGFTHFHCLDPHRFSPAPSRINASDQIKYRLPVKLTSLVVPRAKYLIYS